MEATKTEILGEGALAEGSRTGKLGGRNVQSSDLNPLENAKTKMPAVVKAPREPEAQEQIASGRHSTTVATVPLTLSLNIIGQRKEPDGSYSEIIVREGSILRSHDNFQVHLETNRPAYVYILLYDSQGKASQLFPDPKFDHPGFVKEGVRLVVPSNNLWFWLDEHGGTETLYVLASEKPMSDIKDLLAKMEASDDDGKRRVSQEVKQKIVQRGIAVVAKGSSATYTLSDGKKIQKVTEVVAGTGSVVRAVSFQHR
jgi:hypothetical protein